MSQSERALAHRALAIASQRELASLKLDSLAATPASATFGVSWTDSDGNIFTPSQKVIAPPYLVSVTGNLPFPEGTPAGTEIDLTILGIVLGVTHITIENKTGQELGMAWGGNFFPSLPAGGVFQYCAPTQVQQAGRSILGFRFFTTETVATGALVLYTALGS